MANIPILQARKLFTSAIVDVYKSRPKPTKFLRSFFPVKESATKYVSIEVSRSYESVAIDVERGTNGNRNKIVTSTNKTFEPPYYREFFDITELSHYDYMANGQDSVSTGVFDGFVDEASDRMAMLQDKIDRAYELQCAQVLQTGVVTIAASEEVGINFKRKAASIVDLGTLSGGSANYWDTADPAISLENACIFLRTQGKANTGIFNVILSPESLTSLINNTAVQNRGKIFNYALDVLNPPQRNAEGYSFHGEISVGAWRCRLFTYPQYYDAPTYTGNIITGHTPTPYINPKTAIVLPENPAFIMAFAAVPQLIGIGQAPEKGAYLISDYVDMKLAKHEFHIKSAGIAIPKAIDQIYTIKTNA